MLAKALKAWLNFGFMSVVNIGGIEASRPLAETAWREGFIDHAQDIFGLGAFDFDDEELREHSIILMEPDQVAFMHARTNGLLDNISSDELAGRARANIDDSFNGPTTANLAGSLIVRGVTQSDGSSKPMLMVPVIDPDILMWEAGDLTSSVNGVARYSFPWGNSIRNKPKIRLATLLNEGYYRLDDPRMIELARWSPAIVSAERGKIESATGFSVPLGQQAMVRSSARSQTLA